MKFEDKQQDARLKIAHRKEEEDLAMILSDRYAIPYVNLSIVFVNPDAVKTISEKIAREAGVVVFGLKKKTVEVAALSPQKNSVKEILNNLHRTGYKTKLFIASKTSIAEALEIYKELAKVSNTEEGTFDISKKDVTSFIEEIENTDKLSGILNETLSETSRYKTSRILEIMLGGAIALKASDIHMEPRDTDIRVRFRIDGVLTDLAFLNKKTYKFLLSRIKLLSGLKLNIRESAQDGRFSIKMDVGEIEIRTSVLPGEYGESVVMRVLNPENIQVGFDELGIEPKLLELLKKEASRPHGMILTTGPTGSGKTTTLYSILRHIYTPEIKIITIEDPIEYHIKGISQTQVIKEKDYTFIKGLRSILRQDPDVIMIGEIRDNETAGTAVNSALTGHLVLSTLHTNTAAGVIPRLIDLGINPKIMSSALNVMLAQRLVRKLCESCKQEVATTEKEQLLLKMIIETLSKKRPREYDISKTWKPSEQNDCSVCSGRGYKGRVGVFEGIIMDDNIERITVTENPSEREIIKASEGQGLLTMKEDGVLKVMSGVTSMEELRRVIDFE